MSDPVLPVPDEVTQAWWDATKEQRLLLQRCTNCGHIQHYPRLMCTQCAAQELDWIESSGTGILDGFTTVFRAPSTSFEAPYVIGRVRLTEGPVLLTRIIGYSEDDLACDQQVVVDWWALPDDHQLPVFTLNPQVFG